MAIPRSTLPSSQQYEFQPLPGVAATQLGAPGIRQASFDTDEEEPAEVPPPPAISDVYTDPGVEYFSMDELRDEMRGLVWSKGDYQVVPYGSLRGSMVYATERTSPGAYTFFVFSPEDEGEDTFEIDTRRTRVGIDVSGPDVYVPLFGYAKTKGKLEIDFHGAFAIENKPGVLLRHAYAEVYNDDMRILAGQTWDIISPRIPGVLNYSVGWAAGNIGYRRMQIRMERYLHLGHSTKLSLQGSINQNIVSDFRASTDILPESTNWPVMQGRVAVDIGDCLSGGPLGFGVSGHIGEQGFDIKSIGGLPAHDDFHVQTWSFNFDVRIPFSCRSGFQGEFFTGSDLATELGGILQGVRRNTVDNTLLAIRSTGGWGEFWYDWTPNLHSHVGYSIDDPVNADILKDGRTYNQYYFANIIADVTKKMILGVEVSRWETHYAGKLPGESITFEFKGQYDF